MKLLNYILLLIFIILLSEQKLLSETNLGFFTGLSTPNNEVNNVYNSETININSLTSGKLIREASSFGYHIGAKARFSLSDNFSFTGSAAWHKFTESNIEVTDPISGDTLAHLSTVQNIIPITAGINFYFINSAIGIYGTGELAYNYIYNSVDVPYNVIQISIEKSPTDNRVGFSLGAGADFDLQLIILNLEAKYNISNLIGKVSNESTKSYFTLSLGVFF